ncbi:WD repeat and FYVE domain-containing protein 2 isoform X2 [Penaeus vannamei]|uniref:WD repeat and FYVE domain-containing protein 2 n=1 Tax=Penaeus vannamei TaxID=6689 RepID=A0A3R7SUJ8_PENVA|nr:WD repeat and FYVE domain-containing protein 2-like [Penaeus vannamei]ROT75781.1 WD repeat and FYVE domain-containing protein 2 [Penaeus vannamei]
MTQGRAMAAEIKPLRSSGPTKTVSTDKPVLVSKIEGSGDDVNAAVLIDSGTGVISVSDDKSVRIWQRRDSGQYWPSVCHFLPSIPSCFHYTPDNRRMFIGLDNGTVTEFEVATDYNSIRHKRDYLSHQNRVTGVIFCPSAEWVLSVARDKFFVYHCTESGRRLGGHQSSGWCTALQYDYKSKHVFVGDYSGQITMLKLEESGPQVITVLKGHNGSIRSLAWDVDRQLLFSGSYDQSVIVWDIGGGKGTAFELQGHTNKVSSLVYGSVSHQLISGGEDATVVFWDMKANRQETPEWIEADSCQYCDRPFFWNIRAMMDQKQIGLRQHHCRKCGKAVCDSCSSKRSTIPVMGFEFDVRVCDNCHSTISDQERASLAKFHEVKHNIVCMDLDEEAGLLLTVGQDRVMKMWDVSSLLN